MRKVYCAVLLAVASLASAQTKSKPKSLSEPPPKPALVSEPFAKAALHVAIALSDSDGTAAGDEHIKTLFEQAEIEENTPEEKSITSNLKLWSTVHSANVETFSTWMHFTSCVKDRNDPSPEPARVPCPDVVGTANKESGIQKDFTCFNAYKASLKAHASTIPEECNAERAIVGTKEQQEQRRVQDACVAGKTNPDDIAACYGLGKR
ncbi:MAG: hypothetical protein WAN70_18075 [Terriglobales bacterium]|jgi:hypothetical protein